MIMKKRNSSKGFSLVEFVIVIAIIAVLSAIIVPQVLKHVERTRIIKDRQNVQALMDVLITSSYNYGPSMTGDPYSRFSGSTFDEAGAFAGAFVYYDADGKFGVLNMSIMKYVVEAFGTKNHISPPSGTSYQMPAFTSKLYKSYMSRYKSSATAGTTSRNGIIFTLIFTDEYGKRIMAAASSAENTPTLGDPFGVYYYSHPEYERYSQGPAGALS